MCVCLLMDGLFPKLIQGIALFLCQSPDKKKLLTSQKTFDSEGENYLSVLF